MKPTPSAKFRTNVLFWGPPRKNGSDVRDPVTNELLKSSVLLKRGSRNANSGFLSTRAYMRPLRSREIILARQVTNETIHLVTIRYDQFVNSQWGMTWTDNRGKHRAKIIGIVETIPGRELEITVTEHANGARREN
jgi:hypothetical protein